MLAGAAGSNGAPARSQEAPASSSEGPRGRGGEPPAPQEPGLAAVDLTNLFAGVWMGDDEEEAWSQDSQENGHIADAGALPFKEGAFACKAQI